MLHCNSLTKNNQPCKMRVSENSQFYNGMRMCHVHYKSALKNNQLQISNHQAFEETQIILKNKVRCCSKTKSGSRCVKKTSYDNGLCYIHDKINIQNNKNKGTSKQTIEQVSDKIVSMIKSPCINYKIDKKTDCCYVCLEETDKKFSCGHFIHTNCLINTLQSNLKKKYRVFEHKNQYFIIANCLYCKQIAIMKNIPMTEKLERKYDSKKNKMRINNITISHQFIELFLRYDTYETKKDLIQSEEEFLEDLRQLVFDNFATIVFDNYIQQKNIEKIPFKYQKINKRIIIENINESVSNTLYTRFIYDKIKNKLELFFRILENVIEKLVDMDNVQDDLLNLVNVF
jgi:hypothetical protein